MRSASELKRAMKKANLKVLNREFVNNLMETLSHACEDAAIHGKGYINVSLRKLVRKTLSLEDTKNFYKEIENLVEKSFQENGYNIYFKGNERRLIIEWL